MAQFTRIVPILLLFSVLGFSQDGTKPEKADSILGTWLRTQKLPDGSKTSLMKIITSTHFSVFQQEHANAKDHKFQSHAGQYLLQDGVMFETYEFSSNPSILGQTGKCRVTVNGNKLLQIWTLEDGSKSIEEWERFASVSKADTKE